MIRTTTWLAMFMTFSLGTMGRAQILMANSAGLGGGLILRQLGSNKMVDLFSITYGNVAVAADNRRQKVYWTIQNPFHLDADLYTAKVSDLFAGTTEPTWKPMVFDTLSFVQIMGLAFNAKTDRLWLFCDSSSGQFLCRVDRATGVVSPVVPIPYGFYGDIAFDDTNGRGYIGRSDPDPQYVGVYQMDFETGAATLATRVFLGGQEDDFGFMTGLAVYQGTAITVFRKGSSDSYVVNRLSDGSEIGRTVTGPSEGFSPAKATWLRALQPSPTVGHP